MTIREKHALWLRMTHWINGPALLMMIWSGILIYWAADGYAFFFPKGFYETLHIDGRLAEGMAIHFAVAWVFALNGLAYLAYLLASGHWRELLPTRGSCRGRRGPDEGSGRLSPPEIPDSWSLAPPRGVV
jgi:thiosulfate reductase cytochrome b subunit